MSDETPGRARDASQRQSSGDVRLLAVLFLAAAAASGARLWRGVRDGPPAVEARSVRIPVNSCSRDALTALPGIGPALAARLDEARRASPFRELADVARVHGIGPVLAARIAPHVRFDGTGGE